MRPYQELRKTFSRQTPPAATAVRALEEDLRALGYKRSGITGTWGDSLDAAIRAIRIDLCAPTFAPVIAAANTGGAVVANPRSGVCAVEPALSDAIAALVADAAIVKLPASSDAAGENRRVMAAFRAIRSTQAPTPFLSAMFVQESGGRHYQVPTSTSSDSYVIVGLDTNDAAHPGRITSRGYGLGQYTLFHHPPSKAERAAFIDDPAGNVATAFAELRDKFDHAVKTAQPASGADDRLAEHPHLDLRLCRYQPGDARYLSDCKNCARQAGLVDIAPGTPVHAGAATLWAPTQYYPSASYLGVPNRANFLCDWPYAARRYNGSGINSYHYQARILRNLLI